MWFLSNEKLIFQSSWNGHLVQVFETPKTRILRFGNKVKQSQIFLDEPDTLSLAYTRYMTLVLLLCQKIQNVLHIGLGGAVLPRFFQKYFPDVQQDILECNPVVIEIAQQYFHFKPHSIMQVHLTDAAIWNNQGKKYDLIFMDAFTAKGTPEHLQQRTFYAKLSQMLAPDGWISTNTWTANFSLSRQLRIWDTVFCHTFVFSQLPMENAIILTSNTSNPIPSYQERQKLAQHLEIKIPLDFVKMGQDIHSINRSMMLSGAYF